MMCCVLPSPNRESMQIQFKEVLTNAESEHHPFSTHSARAIFWTCSVPGSSSGKAKVPDPKELKLLAKKQQKVQPVCTGRRHSSRCWGRTQNHLEEKSGRTSGTEKLCDKKKLMCLRNEKWIRAAITWIHRGPWLGAIGDSGRLQLKNHIHWAEQ